MLTAIIYVLLAAAKASIITLQAKYPKMLSLFLRGSGCGLSWDKGIALTAATVTGGFVWTYELQCASSAANTTLEVKVLVDDKQWMLGANHHVVVPAGINSVTDIMYPWFYTSKGSLTILNNIYSNELKNFRDVIYYLPPSYNENTLKVYNNLLIMHDGQNLFNPATSAYGTAWMCQDTLDGLIVAGLSDELIIAGAYNTADRIDEYTYVYDPSEGAGGKGDLYLDWIESTLIPLSYTHFRLPGKDSISRDNVGILGSSLGGLISCYGGWTRPSVYGKVGCMSSSFWWDSNDFQNNIILNNNPVIPGEPLTLFYADAGTGSVGEIECAGYTTQIVDYATTVGYTKGVTVSEYIAQGAIHNEASWGARFYVPIEFLYPSTTV